MTATAVSRSDGRAIDRRYVTAGAFVGAVAVSLILTQLVLPGAGGRGTPGAILFQGLVFGMLNSLTTAGLVLIYRSHRIINFAQAGLGVAGGVFTANLMNLLGWPYFVALAGGVLVAAGIALIFQLFFVTRFFNAPRLVLTTLTIAMIPVIQFGTGFVTSLPIFPPVQDRTQEQLLGQGLRLPFEGFTFTVGGFGLEFGFAHVFAVVMSVLALAALALFFQRSRVGIAIRAASENTDRARMLGVSVLVLSMIAWAISGALSGLGVILEGSIRGQISPGIVPTELIIIPLAAAALARFSRYPTAIATAVVISVLREAVRFSYETHLPLIDIGMFVLILVAFLLMRQQTQRSEEAEATAFESAAEPRPIPTEMLSITSLVMARRAIAAGVVLALLIFPLAANPRQINEAGFVILFAITMVSLVPLAGWAGQASLGQFAFAGLAAVLGGALTARAGVSFWIVLILVPFVTAGFALLVGIPALRIRGLFLAVVTFALAVAVQSALFQERYFGWLLPGAVDRPTLFFLDFDDGRSMYYLSLLALVFAVFAVQVLRRSRPGRMLIALRENENNLRSFGVDPTRMRLAAFAISGYLCGLSGVMLAHHHRAVTAGDFPADLSIFVFLFAVVGGVGSTFGVLLGALYFAGQRLITNELWAVVVGPVGILALLYVAPGGLASLVMGLRDGILKIIAQRRQMVVPALFADIDPAALERRVIPLAEPIPGSGLSAMPHDQRYHTESALYGRRGSGVAVGDGRGDDDARAFGAAAQRLAEED